ncbi:MAG: hypothetical protein ACM3NS_03320, partial [Deltaproteobacteria bacterium]
MSGRPAILFLAAFGAGLATGLALFPAPLRIAPVLGAATLAALSGGWVAGPRLASLLAAAALLGALHGGVARARDAAGCAARLPDGAIRLRVRLAEPVADDGGRAQVVP